MVSFGKPSLAIIGGTGTLGSGLAKRWAAAGYEIIIGSRAADKAEAAAATLDARSGTPAPRGASNAEAAKAGELVILTVPWSNHLQLAFLCSGLTIDLDQVLE